MKHLYIQLSKTTENVEGQESIFNFKLWRRAIDFPIGKNLQEQYEFTAEHFNLSNVF